MQDKKIFLRYITINTSPFSVINAISIPFKVFGFSYFEKLTSWRWGFLFTHFVFVFKCFNIKGKKKEKKKKEY